MQNFRHNDFGYVRGRPLKYDRIRYNCDVPSCKAFIWMRDEKICPMQNGAMVRREHNHVVSRTEPSYEPRLQGVPRGRLHYRTTKPWYHQSDSDDDESDDEHMDNYGVVYRKYKVENGRTHYKCEEPPFQGLDRMFRDNLLIREGSVDPAPSSASSRNYWHNSYYGGSISAPSSHHDDNKHYFKYQDYYNNLFFNNSYFKDYYRNPYN